MPAGHDWYQYANRLAHAYLLDRLNGIPTRLVFLARSSSLALASRGTYHCPASCTRHVVISFGSSGQRPHDAGPPSMGVNGARRSAPHATGSTAR